MSHAFSIVPAILAASSVAATSFAGVPSTAVAFEAPVWRGGASTEYAGWERFVTPVGANPSTDPGSTAGPDAVVVQSTAPNFNPPPGILLTGTGNLYSGFQLMSLSVANAVGAPLTEVVLQTRTAGGELNSSGVSLRYTDAQGQAQSLAPTVAQELFREDGSPIFPGFSSSIVERRWTWDLGSLGAAVTSFSIALPQSTQHMSLERVELDTLSVPAPGALALAGLGAALMPQRRRRASTTAHA